MTSMTSTITRPSAWADREPRVARTNESWRQSEEDKAISEDALFFADASWVEWAHVPSMPVSTSALVYSTNTPDKRSDYVPDDRVWVKCWQCFYEKPMVTPCGEPCV